ncbi:kinase-like domain-containing protein, partial [Hyaloraphidium curvatum]
MSSPPLDLRYPDLDYTLLKRIGEGAFAAVFSALGPHGPCAVKVVRKALLTPKQRADVLKEVSLLRRIDHPNIIRLLDFGESRESLPEDRAEGGEEGYYYLVLELMPGGELFTRVQELTFLSEEASRRVIVQVALAVHHLHRIGIVHRDIKLENLLFAPSPSYDPSLPTDDPRMQEDGGIGTVKLADFGLSKEIHHDLTATPCGTIGYTAPEIVLSNPYSKNVDIWALGCVLYTLLCGYPPFGGEAEEVTRRVAGGGWEFGRPWWDHVGWEAKDLITNSLILDPQRRFTIEQFLSHPWIRPELERLGMRPPAPQLAPAAAALAGRQGPAVPVWEKPPAP